MKILMYSNHFGGPTTTFIMGDLKGLVAQNKVVYACVGTTTGQFVHDDVRVLPYKINPLLKKIRWILEKNGWNLTFKSSVFSNALNKLLDEFKPDIVQFNFGYEALMVTDNLAVRHRDLPMVINFLGYDASFHLKRNSYVNKLKELAARENVFATCNTGFLKKNLEERKIFFRENKIIYTGVDTDFFIRDDKRSKEHFTFLQIATLAKRKGQEVTLHAFREFLNRVPDPDHYRLILAGGAEDEYGKTVRELPKILGIEKNIVFHDWITREQARDLMNRANCFLHHSCTVDGRTEGIPTAISEAMSMELPVISTFHAGIPELVEDGVNGFLVNERDVNTYADRMKQIISWDLKPVNREKIINKFNIQKRTDQFLNYYHTVLMHLRTSNS